MSPRSIRPVHALLPRPGSAIRNLRQITRSLHALHLRGDLKNGAIRLLPPRRITQPICTTPSIYASFALMPDRNFFAAYGLLRRRSLARRGHRVLQHLRYYGTGLLRGIAFVQHGYPGVVEQPGLVLVEIFEVLNNSVWEILDRFEGYDASRGRHTLFYRKQVQLLRPKILVSVYFLGREIPRGRRCNAELGFAPLMDRPRQCCAAEDISW